MKVLIRGKDGFKITEAIRNYVEDKISKIGHYFTDTDELEARVVCKVYNHKQKVEVTIPTNQILLRAEDIEGDLYAAIDLVIDKLDKQIRRHKDKINSIYRHREGVANFFKSNEELDINELEAKIVGESLVKNKKVSLEPMTVDDAIMNMELVDHSFYVFLNKETDKVNIVYKREDDTDYAVIETH
ncbi:ribosome hibernation-promoting factor, HPF/YfiA family [Haloplasma contractile]|uniref:Ribosome hibernation promoting factor n=1 Tax=Haloplasma contractile SSD-17B TaxID=1033810 RepID=U2FEQ0_9MOLU|nr:ribosome-associated translation inhibitor RaiA [Haloplasma contractile]ERJ11425.1 Ribosomal subunit interface protein [Haloplasma contractile SSD-17B]